jgi:hypothetical protein
MPNRHFYYDELGRIPNTPPARVVLPAHFVATVAANIDNDRLTDAEFREFIRNSLPIVDYPRPEKDNETR